MAEKALNAIKNGFITSSRSPFTCRKADQSPFLRKLIIPFGRSGYVALFEIVGSTLVVIAAVRYQRDDDCHGRTLERLWSTFYPSNMITAHYSYEQTAIEFVARKIRSAERYSAVRVESAA